uniref:G_PROTEIN_RECEP_F1_2 domain-containing protein n=1 Tax=Bursaphelenchus xylophilus TaxID=6326 RepID=A0A1I7S7Z9_BURXY
MATFHYHPHDMNPYAWDTPLNSSFPSEIEYNSVETLESIINVLYKCSSCVGGILTFILLYLVLFRSRGELKPYSKILLLCGMSDFGYWLTDSTVQFACKINDGVLLVKMNGPAKYLSYNGQAFALTLYVMHLTLVATILPSQYFSRYYAITRGRTLTGWQTFGLYCLSMSVSIPMALTAYPGYRYSGDGRPGFNYATLWYDMRPVPTLLVGDTRDFYMQTYFMLAFFSLSGSYVLATYFGVLTIRKLKQNAHMYTEKTQKMQEQLNRTLIAQTIICRENIVDSSRLGIDHHRFYFAPTNPCYFPARLINLKFTSFKEECLAQRDVIPSLNFIPFQSILPLCVSVGPAIGIVVPSFTRFDTGVAALITGNILSWVPVFNPLFTILVITPYRRHLKALIFGPINKLSMLLGRPSMVVEISPTSVASQTKYTSKLMR